MTGVLKGPQLAEQDRVAEMNVGAGGVNAELDAQRPTFAFGLGQAGRQLLIGVASGLTSREQIGDTPLQPLRQSPRTLGHCCRCCSGADRRQRPSGFLLEFALHALERALHLLKHLLRRHAELTELGAQLLHGELGLEIL